MAAPNRSPYRRVEVMGYVWEGHNHRKPNDIVKNADEELHMVMKAFRNYGYNTQTREIPENPNLRRGFPGMLRDKFERLGSTDRTLLIFYYQGHGDVNREGKLVLSNGNGQSMPWDDIFNPVITARNDVLVLLNCCHAGAALHSISDRPRANYPNRVKQVIMATPKDKTTSWGKAWGFAACLEEALVDHQRAWDRNFDGSAGHFAQAINRNLERRQRGRGTVGVKHLAKPPQHRENSPIVLCPMR